MRWKGYAQEAEYESMSCMALSSVNRGAKVTEWTREKRGQRQCARTDATLLMGKGRQIGLFSKKGP